MKRHPRTYSRLRSARRRWPWFNLSPTAQYATTAISAIVFAGVLFSGFLLYRYTDATDLIQRGKRQLMEGKVAWATRTFETLVSRHPGLAEGHLLLGEAYLQLGERQKAEQQFWLAASEKGDAHPENDPQPVLALARLAMARGDFGAAEERLLDLKAKQPQSQRLAEPIRQGLFDLYDRWGDTLKDKDHDLDGAVTRYHQALPYIQDIETEDRLKNKLMDTLATQADRLLDQHDYVAAAKLLQKSLRLKYLPDTLIAIAESYERADKMDDALLWYRKAYDANPSVISLKLASLLVQRGEAMLKAKKPAEAEKLFAEAHRISAATHVPMEKLYPVSAQSVRLRSAVDEAAGQVSPTVTLTLRHLGTRPLPFLKLRAQFFSEDETLAESVETVALPDQPLSAKGQKDDHKRVTLSPAEPISTLLLGGQPLKVRLSVAYTDDERAVWRDVAIQEARLPAKPKPEPTTTETDETPAAGDAPSSSDSVD